VPESCHSTWAALELLLTIVEVAILVHPANEMTLALRLHRQAAMTEWRLLDP
jgi:hypothetical protein